jgi:hypothetical protein
MRYVRVIVAGALLGLVGGCSGGPLEGGAGVDASGGDGSDASTGVSVDAWAPPSCEPATCEVRGWSCGQFVSCGVIVDCADEGLSCSSGEACVGGVDGPTECVTAGGSACEVCDAIPDCSEEAQPTRLAGRVVTAGRADDDDANQVGVPNALVFILSTRDTDELPEIPTGLPPGETSCSRCEDQAELMGPFLTGGITDATGHFEFEGDIPVGEEIVLVTMAGKFRRATTITLSADDACTDIDLPTQVSEGNPTRLPRHLEDGLAVNIPRIAVATGRIDAMECVLEKIGLDHDLFDNHDNEDSRINLFRGVDGTSGMRINSSTPADTVLYSDLSLLESYDMFIADCQGSLWDSDFDVRDAHGDRIREYVNRGGRMFASHLSHSWLHENGDEAYDPADPIATGLGPSGTYSTDTIGSPNAGDGRISIDRDNASPRLEQYIEWVENEGIASGPDYEFEITHPRGQAEELGPHTEEFAFCTSSDCVNEAQQFSFDTPYGAPPEEACGRVAYTGFHVVAAGSSTYENLFFPDGCGGDLSDQEKLLLFMIFDLAACIGDPLPPECQPRSCEDTTECGLVPDGCGELIDCGLCPIE